MENKKTAALQAHEEWHGKIETLVRSEVNNKAELAVAYTPGVAEPCISIKNDPEEAYRYTRKWNTVCVLSDGSAVLGLGNLGGLAGLPVMEGKSVLFKTFGNVDAFPIVLSTQNTEEIIATAKAIAPSFGGINLEDISAPRCFEIERRLKEELDIPVFHDDQHGTAIVVLAGLINALKVVHKTVAECKVVLNGPGAAGTAICKLLLSYGFDNIILCDEHGTLYNSREHMDWAKTELASLTNKENLVGSLKDAIKGADIFIGVSVKNALCSEDVATMNRDAIVFAMANPAPEIMPEDARRGGAAVVATGRSDYPNQINNVLAFPGIFRGAFDARAKAITEEMKLAAAEAIASLITEENLSADCIIPDPFDKRVAAVVAEAVYNTAKGK
ncbi:MAG: NADP-dependent malic enzyme [Clostridia bacterium]|nr:NADP-dependent malic enzyme [Clostridia bacterium]